ncbi:rho GTPase-activating protein gacN-like [Paramacrobiotus metropolitanus]|uniref:rho GTPase-activating protein gacN-like n=1 Tax=Paramacrobiotus metropolitanus TaxID=2943436 RepID=UPI0024460A70|nr:rho GTPase-activating protein gacN-like [Paramacrobiotus metropolitanus]
MYFETVVITTGVLLQKPSASDKMNQCGQQAMVPAQAAAREPSVFERIFSLEGDQGITMAELEDLQRQLEELRRTRPLTETELECVRYWLNEHGMRIRSLESGLTIAVRQFHRELQRVPLFTQQVIQELGVVQERLEGIQKANKQLSEAHDEVNKRLERMEEDIRVMKLDIQGFKDDLRGIKVDLGGIKNGVKEVKNDISGIKTEFRQDVADVKKDIADMKKDIEDFKQEMKKDIQDFKQEMKKDIQDFKQEMKKDIADFKQDIMAEMKVINDKLTKALAYRPCYDRMLTTVVSHLGSALNMTQQQFDSIAAELTTISNEMDVDM